MKVILNSENIGIMGEKYCNLHPNVLYRISYSEDSSFLGQLCFFPDPGQLIILLPNGITSCYHSTYNTMLFIKVPSGTQFHLTLIQE